MGLKVKGPFLHVFVLTISCNETRALQPKCLLKVTGSIFLASSLFFSPARLNLNLVTNDTILEINEQFSQDYLQIKTK